MTLWWNGRLLGMFIMHRPLNTRMMNALMKPSFKKIQHLWSNGYSKCTFTAPTLCLYVTYRVRVVCNNCKHFKRPYFEEFNMKSMPCPWLFSNQTQPAMILEYIQASDLNAAIWWHICVKWKCEMAISKAGPHRVLHQSDSPMSFILQVLSTQGLQRRAVPG